MTKLDKGTVIAAALELLNEVGMDSLTTRKAVSAVIAPSLALPRIPSVPKYLRTIRSIILSSGRPQRGHAC